MPNNELWYVMRIKLIVMRLSEEENAQEDLQKYERSYVLVVAVINLARYPKWGLIIDRWMLVMYLLIRILSKLICHGRGWEGVVVSSPLTYSHVGVPWYQCSITFCQWPGTEAQVLHPTHTHVFYYTHKPCLGLTWKLARSFHTSSKNYCRNFIQCFPFILDCFDQKENVTGMNFFVYFLSALTVITIINMWLGLMTEISFFYPVMNSIHFCV